MAVIKTIDGLAFASVKTWLGTAIASVKTINGLDASGFTATTAVFDGTNDYISRASLTGCADGKAFTFSGWVKMGVDSAANSIFTIARTSATDYSLIIRRTAGNKIQIQGKSSGGTVRLDATTNTGLVIADGWVHLFIAIDLASTSSRHVYFNGTEDTSVTWTTYDTTTALDLAAARNRIGCDGATTPGERLNATVCEFWFDDTYNNIPTSFASGGRPISLGSTGQTPTGSSPVYYLSLNGSGDSWATDSSSNANTFTVTGALGTGTPP